MYAIRSYYASGFIPNLPVIEYSVSPLPSKSLLFTSPVGKINESEPVLVTDPFTKLWSELITADELSYNFV